jgi:hypothetical protein
MAFAMRVMVFRVFIPPFGCMAISPLWVVGTSLGGAEMLNLDPRRPFD